MDNNQQQRLDELKQQQQQDKQDTLERGIAYEEMIRSKGWKFLQATYTGLVQEFATAILTNDETAVTEFEAARQQLVGIRKLLGGIDEDLKFLEDERRKDEPKAA